MSDPRRFNPYKLADNLIEQDYRIPVMLPITLAKKGESFMTAMDGKTVNLGEYLDFLRKTIHGLQQEILLYSEYHKLAHEIRNTTSRSEYKEGCKDTFGAGFFLEYDEYKDFRELYWKIQKIKEGEK